MSFNQNVWCITLVNKRILEDPMPARRPTSEENLKFHVTEDDHDRSHGSNSCELRCGNDPSAGSPTETLLRLHLPLNDEV